MQRFFLCLAFATAACGQVATYQGIDFSIGARAGILLNRGVGDSRFGGGQLLGFSRNDTQRLLVGPTFEVGFKERWAVEFSPTWRRTGTSSYFDTVEPFPAQLPPGQLITRGQLYEERRNTWDLPLLGKFYFTKRAARVRPFLGAGVMLSRSSSQFNGTVRLESAAGERRLNSWENRSSRWNQAPTAAAGVAFRSGRFSLVPEFRYTYDGPGQYPGTKNRVEFLLGFRF